MGTTFYGLAEGRSKCSVQAILYFHAPPDDVHSLLPTKEMDNSSTTKTTFVKSLTIRGKRGKYVPVGALVQSTEFNVGISNIPLQHVVATEICETLYPVWSIQTI